MIRVMLPPHLRIMARVDGEVVLEVEGTVTLRSVLDALETAYPVLRAAPSATRPRSGGDRSCGSSRADRISLTSRPTFPSPRQSQRAPSHW